MPTYEYICRACTHAFEEFQSIKADPIRVCPKCRKKKVERLIGIGGAVIFKGGGFYETDYRSANYEAGKKAGDEAASKSSDAATASTTASTTASDAKDAKTPAAKDGKTDAKSTAPTASTATSTSAESSKTTADSKSDSKQESSASSDNKRIADRATHPSRIGRGIGNIVKKAAAKKPAAKSRKR